MRLDVITIFPAMFDSVFSVSLLKKARESGRITLNLVDLRDFTQDRHRSVDDRPYGGGPGMVMKPEPFFDAVEHIRTEKSRTILLSPQGQTFCQNKAIALSKHSHLILLCGHYEGFDERIRMDLVDEEISIGDYILTNGNLSAMVLIDAVVRLLPGVVGCPQSTIEESFSDGLLEYPQYTRPPSYRGMAVPDVLLSGDHRQIERWREQQSRERTQIRRPDLMKS